MMMSDNDDKLQASTSGPTRQLSRPREAPQTTVGRKPRKSQKRPCESDLSSSTPSRASELARINQPPDQSTRVAQTKSTVADRQARLPAGAIEASQLETNKDRQCLEFGTARPLAPAASTSTFQLALRGISESTALQGSASRDQVQFSAFPNIAQEPISPLAGIHTFGIRARPNVQPAEAIGFAPTAATNFHAGVATGSPVGGIAGPQPNLVANLRSTTAETDSLVDLYNEWATDDWPDPISDAFVTQDGVVDDEAPWGAHRSGNDSRTKSFAQNPITSLTARDSPAIGGVLGSVGASDRCISTECASIRGVSNRGESREMASRRPASTRGASRKDVSCQGASVVRASSRGAQRKDASYRASESPSLRTLGMEDNVSGSKLVSNSKAASSDAAQRNQSAQPPEAAKKQHHPLPSLAFSNDEISQIKEYRADKKSWRWIGEAMGIPRGRLREAKDMGLFAEGGVSLSAPKLFSDEQISQIKQYRAQKKIWEYIAKETGTSLKRLRNAAEKGLFGEVPVKLSAQKPISDEQISQIKKYCTEGLPWSWIACKVNINRSRLVRRAAEGLFGIEGKEKLPANSKQVRFTEDQMCEIKEYRIQKKSWDWIAIKMEVNKTTLQALAHEKGVQ